MQVCIIPFVFADRFLSVIGRSILYKTKLPFILVFNKTDVQPHDFAVEWMHDFEAFQAALAAHQGTADEDGEPTYMNSLMNSMSLVLDEFYQHLKVSRVDIFSVFMHVFRYPEAVGVSSVTGNGVKEFFEAVEASRDEYQKFVIFIQLTTADQATDDPIPITTLYFHSP